MMLKYKHWIKGALLVFLILMTAGAGGDLSAKDRTYEELKLFSDVLEEIENGYVEPVESKELIEKAIHGLINSLDPHSAFLPPEAFENLQEETKGEFGGIGIVITKRNNLLTVVSPVEGTPAYKAGVKANDVILKVDGKATQDLMLWEAVNLMRGKPGTTVKITVLHEGGTEPVEFSLVRDIIPLDSVRYVNLGNGYGYIWVTNFRENTTEEVNKALADLEKQNNPMKGLILDLRDNPGGLLNQAVAVSDIFLEEGTIVSIRGRDKKQEDVFRAEPNGNKNQHDYPIVLLINGGSASASEIVAGALQDNRRALVLGTSSFGKGSVQTVKPLRNGYALKYTIARYYTPNGTSIQAAGIHPDLVVKRRLLDENATGGLEAERIKEQDLKGHLMNELGEPESVTPAEPDMKEDKPAKESNADEETDMEKLLRLREAVYEDSGKGPETLLLDSQVNRAYEILRGYEIFQAFGNKTRAERQQALAN